MKIRRIKAITKKEFIHILRDPYSLTMAIILPLLLLLIYGYAVTFDVENIPSGVLDRDRSQQSREFLRHLSSSGYFRLLHYVESDREMETLLQRGKLKVAFHIPEDFGKKIRKGERVDVAVVLDGTDSNTALIVQGYLYSLFASFNGSINPQLLRQPLDARTRIWFNSEVKSRNFLIPGLISVIMAVIISLLTSLTIAREWDRGTMEQLISSPVKKEELVLGKIVPYFFIVFLDVVLTFLMGTRFFDVPFRGSVALLFLLSSIFLFGGLSYGVLVSILGKTQTLATQIAMLSTFLPAFLLSGFIFPISNMPEFIRPVTYLVPARYYVTILKGLFLKGSTIQFLLLETTLLSAYGILVFFLAVKAFRKRID